MKISTTTYQRFTNATALLLLIAFLIPSTLQAKQLVDFCKMEMHHHDGMEMVDDHSCCTEEVPSQHDSHQNKGHDNCDDIQICACELDHSYFEVTDWILVSNEFTAYLPKQIDLTPFTSSDESIHQDQKRNQHEHSPPIWLVYDTLLL
ncbi:hypothetical protein [Rhodohalobacter sp.]|uniref:hypothetical protein n=1 Tax=Rhodohalobacter sp. TaxID=1974210 RepID=UPI002ACE41B6|nr:hypothetical protein [Rhodohalobacter sp.]MDZ7755769.1 hypothetical protein [Rhodohalobacter sp.]